MFDDRGIRTDSGETVNLPDTSVDRKRPATIWHIARWVRVAALALLGKAAPVGRTREFWFAPGVQDSPIATL